MGDEFDDVPEARGRTAKVLLDVIREGQALDALDAQRCKHCGVENGELHRDACPEHDPTEPHPTLYLSDHFMWWSWVQRLAEYERRPPGDLHSWEANLIPNLKFNIDLKRAKYEGLPDPPNAQRLWEIMRRQDQAYLAALELDDDGEVISAPPHEDD